MTEHDDPSAAEIGERATEAVIGALESAGIDYMVVGSFSTNCHTQPRSTRDADLVVAPPGGPVARVLRSLPKPYRLDPQIGFESVTGTTRYLLEVEGATFKVECFLLSDDPHDQERFARRERLLMLPGLEAWVAAAEDVIVTKLRWAKDAGRGKDRDDVRNVLGSRAGELDLPYIERWAAEHGTLDLYREIAASIPPLD
ncbi:hypothetical protein [Alienimonas chondri]|uniref:Nucleotidyltransferase domain-containing protein n=1 Tax=Alienimonas chondri TaxID=2681879 RepID=A0ABX1VAS8_9PLAN|nr:hypothetical protein [Alienimonas chondri]NNJ24136.1 hypothetical protein [Alienimonas chondri]